MNCKPTQGFVAKDPEYRMMGVSGFSYAGNLRVKTTQSADTKMVGSHGKVGFKPTPVQTARLGARTGRTGGGGGGDGGLMVAFKMSETAINFFVKSLKDIANVTTSEGQLITTQIRMELDSSESHPGLSRCDRRPLEYHGHEGIVMQGGLNQSFRLNISRSCVHDTKVDRLSLIYCTDVTTPTVLG
ncbi:hypothetical protein K440DRAFT_643076 [Wilcoxina mikolae CBS 423.85]|nr:hypothetical protein K440DRAFT_643076 [Wilcoxina mikolae CBS 423.85]